MKDVMNLKKEIGLKDSVMKSIFGIDDEMLRNLKRRMEESQRKDTRITAIYTNTKKRTVTVKFENGEVRTATCAEGDQFDVEMGVAICLMSLFFGSKNNAKKVIKKLTKDSTK